MATLATLAVRITADSAGFVRGVRTAEAGLVGLGRNMRAQGAAMSAVGSRMTRSMTVPLLALAGASVKMAVDFDTSMTNIKALVGASEAQMKQYRTVVLDLARELPQTPKELADALYFVTSAGFEGAEALDILKASAKAAAAGLGDTKGVADIVTSAVNAYGIANLKASDATDILLAAVREGKAEPEAFATVLGRVIPIAEAMGVEFHETAASVAAMTLSGLNAAESTTALRGLMSSIIKPSKDAAKAFKEVGLPIEDFRKSVAEKGLMPALMELRERIGGNKEMMGRLFPNVRALAGFLNLTGRNAEKNAQVFKDLAKAGGDTDRAFKEASKSLGFQFKSALSTIQVAMITLGEVIAPVFLDIAQAVAKGADAFSKLPTPVIETVVKVGALIAVLGPLVFLFGKIWSVIGTVVTVIGHLVGPVKLVAGLLFGFVKTAAALLHILYLAFGPIVIVIGAVAAAAFLIYKNWDTVKEFLLNIWEIIKSAASAVKDFFVNLWKPVGAAFSSAWNAIKSFLSGVWSAIAGFFRKIWQSEIANEFRKTLDQWKQWITSAWNFIKGITTTVWNGIKAVLTVVWNAIKAAASAVWNALKTYFTTVNNAIKAVFSTVWNAIKPLVLGVWNALKAAATTVFNAIKTVITTVLQAIKLVFSTTWNAVKVLVVGVWNAIKSVVQGAIEAVRQIIIAVLRALRGDWQGAWQAIKASLSAAWNGIKNAVKIGVAAVVSFMRALPGKILSALGSLGSLLISAGGDLLRGLITGIKNMVGSAVSAVKDAVGSVVKGAKSALGIGSPSKVFKQIGMDTMQGMINGMDRQQSRLESRIDNIISKIKDGLGGAVKKASLAAANDFKDMLKSASRDLDKATRNFEKVKEQVDSLKDSFESGFKGFRDIAGFKPEEGGLTGQAVISQLGAQLGDAQAFSKAIKSLVNKGLNKTLLSEIIGAGPEGLQMAQALASSTQAEIDQVNSMLKEIDSVRESVESFSVKAIFGDQLAAAGTAVQKAEQQFARLSSQLDAFSAAVDRNIAKFTEAEKQAEELNVEKVEVLIPAKDLKEMKEVDEFFDKIKQGVRKGAGKKGNRKGGKKGGKK